MQPAPGHVLAATCPTLRLLSCIYTLRLSATAPLGLQILWAKISNPKFKKSIGLVLMDQALVAGLGNIYRAEVSRGRWG